MHGQMMPLLFLQLCSLDDHLQSQIRIFKDVTTGIHIPFAFRYVAIKEQGHIEVYSEAHQNPEDIKSVQSP